MAVIYLAHHGIEGQKWGVRRFQNPDGTLTEDGKKRYSRKTDRAVNKYYKKMQKQIDANSRSLKYIKKALKDPDPDLLEDDPETKKAYKSEAKTSQEAIKHWVEYQEKVMNSISAKEASEYYKEAIRTAKLYYPFA